MYRLYDYLESGNSYKVRLLLATLVGPALGQLGEMAQNTPAYLERQSTNPMLTAAAFKQERGPITTVGNTGEGVSDSGL